MGKSLEKNEKFQNHLSKKLEKEHETLQIYYDVETPAST